MADVGIDRRLDSFDRGLAVEGTPAVVDMSLKLRVELVHVRRDWIDRKVAERAQRLPEHAVADVAKQIELVLLRVASLDPCQQLHEPARSLATRRALAA